MPLTSLDFPILVRFLCVAETMTNRASSSQEDGESQTKLPPGMILGPDGKPCRTCNTLTSLRAAAKGITKGSPSPTASTTTNSILNPSDCPADVEVLGRSTWTFLHTLTATYPTRPTAAQQSDTRQLLSLFGNAYPCHACAEDFRGWMAAPGNAPRVSSREEFGRWMCEAHNAVNVKLGKQEFDCAKWEERWRTGWKDGRCD